jgi:phosphate-selective porin OprO/OprP
VLRPTQLRVMCGSVIFGCLTALSTPTMAANDAMQDLLEILRQKGSITNEEYQLLRNAAEADGEKIEAVKQEAEAAADEAKEAAKSLPEINTKGKLEITSADGNYEWRIGGRLQYDATWTDRDGTDIGNSGQEFRRARLYASGVIDKVWKWKFQFDFTDLDDEPQEGIEDAYVEYTGMPVSIAVGQKKAPFTLEEMTSSKYITFIERSMVVNAMSSIVGNRRGGLHFHTKFNDQFTLGAAVTGNRVTADDFASEYAFTARGTWSPIHNDQQSVHLGVGGGYRNIDEDLRVRARPGWHLTDRPVNTGSIAVDSVTSYGVEAAWVYGPWSVQGEYIQYDGDEAPGVVVDQDGSGYYVYGSYYLTGETRRYNWKGGNFKSTKVRSPFGKGGPGAWEVAARYGSLDLDDALGGEIDAFTAALNWYVNNNIMFKLNYNKVLDCSDNCDLGLGATPSTIGTTGGEPSAVTLRTQVFF